MIFLIPPPSTHLDRAGFQDVSGQVSRVAPHQQLLVPEEAQRPPLRLTHSHRLLLLLLLGLWGPTLRALEGQWHTTDGRLPSVGRRAQSSGHVCL
jgi:hypothetical protein